MERSLADLKSTAFGGFDKESVLRYLREVAVEHDEETDSLQKQIRELQKELEALRQTTEQQEDGRTKLDQVSRIADAIQNQSKTLERLLSENQRLQTEVDQYRAQEKRIQEQERSVQEEVEAMRAQARDDCARLKRNAALEAQELVRSMEGKIASMAELSQEFSALCRKGEQLIQRYGG
ncbi:hypothetical protein ACTQ33_15140 [Candidatus Avoscillospira sp. LCP25S3_F1]|uniref:hypothetical protein n=1 Tax=Candidatus Avoscillospira sp. LCP25S3_F1 TaxID=3438825 RepID=UPI003F8EC158